MEQSPVLPDWTMTLNTLTTAQRKAEQAAKARALRERLTLHSG